MKRLQTAANVLMGIVATIAAVLMVGTTALPAAFGSHVYVVLSGSMEPAVRTGSIVLAVPAAPSSLKVGDVITYNRSDTGTSVTHRINQVKESGDRPVFVTKGDANAAPDTWTVQYSGHTAGKVVVTVPLVGYIYHWVGGPQGRLVFLVVPVVTLSLMWLWRIWRPSVNLDHRERELPANMAPAVDLTPAKLPASDPQPIRSHSVPLRQ